MKDGKPETIGEAIEDTIKTGRRWGLRGFPGSVLGTPKEWRDHCMSFVSKWENSAEFIERINLQYDAKFKE